MGNKTTEIPTLDLLEKLIMDDSYFYEFSNNKSNNIYGFDIQFLLKHLKDFIISNLLTEENLSQNFIERAKYYNDKFNLDIPRFRQIRNGIDSDFYNYIIKDINNLTDPLAKAKAIYLNLAKTLCYDEHFPAYGQNLDNPYMEDIYYTETSKVTVENNKITCALWAELYVEFLKSVGIDAQVITDGKHKFVEFTIESVVYKADATNSFLDQENIYLNDLTRVKLNSPIVGFSAVTKGVDATIGYSPIPLVEQYKEFVNKHAAISSMRLTTNDKETDSILSKLDYLSTMIYGLPIIEAVGFLKRMVEKSNSIMSKEATERIIPVQIRLKDQNNLAYTSLVIAVKFGEDYIYRLLNVPEGLIDVSKEYFENLIKNGQMIDDGNIPGLNQMNR